MNKFLRLLLALFIVGLCGQINAQCDFDPCPDIIIIDVMSDACDETTGEILNITGYDYDDGGTGAIMDETEFLGIAGSPGVNGDCDGSEMYGYTDDVIQLSGDCLGDGYYSFFERTWEIFDAGGVSTGFTCVQTIGLNDLFNPFESSDLVAFFEDQDPDGLEWTIVSNDCPITSIIWSEPVAGVDFEDNCSPGNAITITATHVSGQQFDQGITTITYSFTDQCGNREDFTWDVEIECITCMGAPVFEDCTSPPIECDLNVINGFMSCTPDYNGGTFGDLCNGQGAIHNASYFSFVAGSEDIDITLGVSDCVPNGGSIGVQANVIDPCDANTCYGDSGAACFDSQFSFGATGLTIGNVYQLIVDGCNGSECAYTVSIDSAPPFEIPDPEAPEAIVEDPNSCIIDVNNILVCPGTVVTFNPENFVDAEFFFCWTIDNPAGATAQNNDTDCMVALTGGSFNCTSTYSSCGPLELEFTMEGTYQLCLTEMDNGCDNNSENDYGAYCFDIEVVTAVDLDFGAYEICESQLPFFTPPPHAGTGEQWQGPTGGNLVLGTNTFMVEDDCDCNYSQFVEISVLPQDPQVNLQIEWCEYELTSWSDPTYGVSWDDIQSFMAPGNPYLFENVFIEGGSALVGWDGANCDLLVNYEFIAYEIPGAIMQTNGSACDATLCYEVDVALFPGFMNEGDIGYSWTDAGGGVIGLQNCVSVSTAGNYTVNMSYIMDNGMTCTFSEVIMADLSGSTPGVPAFTNNPTTACASATTGLIYSVLPSATSTFTWMATNGTITGGQGTNEIMVDVLDTGQPMTISVFAETPGCGMSPPAMATLTVTPDPVVTLDAVPDVCVGSVANLNAVVTVGTASNYIWTIPDPNAIYPGVNNNLSTLPVTWNTPGMQSYTLSVSDASGCESMEITGMVNVVAPLEAPTGMCTIENSNSVTIEWTDVAGQTTIVTPSMMGTQTGNTYTVNGLTSGQMVTFNLVTDGATHPCGNSAPLTLTCEASSCTLDPMVSSPENNICMDGSTAPFQLAATPMGGTWSGTGVDANGMFDPAAAIAGDNVISYEVEDLIQACTATGFVTITVFAEPDPTFALSATEICIGELVTITYVGMVGETTSWEYGTGVNPPSNIMPNQFDVSYQIGGDKVINLEVSNGTCMVEYELTLTVFPALPAPIITCSPTPNSVEFSWDAIPGVTEYIVEVTSGGNTTTETQATTVYPVGGLSAGDNAVITVTAVDPNGCENSFQINDCTAQDCPIYTVALDAGTGGTAACNDPNGVTFILNQTVTDELGNPVTGTGNWSGAGIDPVTGIFSTMLPGDYTITYNFLDDTNCQGIGMIELNVFDLPNSDFATDVDQLCLGDELTLIIDDNYSAGLTYDWTSDTDAGNYDLVDNGDGSFTVIFSSDPGGDVEFSLIVDAGNCQSDPADYTVEVLAPLPFTISPLTECYSIDESIDLGPFDGNGDPVAGSWEIVDGGLLPGSTFNPTINDTVYTLIFTEANCGVSDMIDVEVIEQPDLAVSPLTQTICISEMAAVSITSQFYDEVIHLGDQPPLNGLEPDFTLGFPNAGTYEYTSVIDRQGDCDSDEIQWEIIVEEEPALPVISCTEQTLSSVTFGWTQVPCAVDYTIIINGPNGEQVIGTITDTEFMIDNLGQGDEIEISVAINSDCACEFSDALITSCSAMACEPATITIGNELDSEYCVSDIPAPFELTSEVAGIDIDNSGLFTYTGPGISSDGMIDLSSLAGGDYTITVLYSEDGCDYTEDISYVILGAPSALFDIQDAPCPEATEGIVNITPVGNGPFTIDSGQTLVEGSNNLTVGNHTIMITDSNGCTYEETITVGQAAAPDVNFVVPIFAYTENAQTFSLDLSGISMDSVIWSIDGSVVENADCSISDCNSYEFTPIDEQFYNVCVEAFYGTCIYTECREMEAEEFQIKSLYIPNIFDPSGSLNPENSTLNLYIEGCDLVIKDISIYDRWGNRVHNDSVEKIGADEDVISLWDGTFNAGTDFVPGVYIYVMEIEYEDGFTEFMAGDVTIVQ